MAQHTLPEGPLAAEYARLGMKREPYLRRARDSSMLTIPEMVPPEGYDGSAELFRPHQNMGAKGVNNLASRLLLTLYPVGSPFMRLRPSAEASELLEESAPEEKAEIEADLSTIESRIHDDIEESGDRALHFETLKHLISISLAYNANLIIL